MGDVCHISICILTFIEQSGFIHKKIIANNPRNCCNHNGIMTISSFYLTNHHMYVKNKQSKLLQKHTQFAEQQYSNNNKTQKYFKKE